MQARTCLAFIGAVCFSLSALAQKEIVISVPQPAPIVKNDSPVNIIKLTHASTFHIAQQTLTGGGMCSATAIGPHALLTATHCEEPSDTLYVEEIEDALHIQSRIRDENDHTIFIVDAEFTDFVSVKLNDDFDQGEELFYFGNPGKFHDLYRRGYVSGSYDSSSVFNQRPLEILFDFNGWFGDSGAGIFNKDGQVIAVVSTVTEAEAKEVHIKLTGAYPFKFKQDDLDRVHKQTVIHVNRSKSHDAPDVKEIKDTKE